MIDLLRKLFGKKTGAPDLEAATAHILRTMTERALPTILLDGAEGEVVVRLGGVPRLPSADLWPDRGGRLLPFIAELDLSALHADGGPDWLPAEGFLHVFYDAGEQPWGFDPKDRGGLVIVYTRSAADTFITPAGVETFSPRLLRPRPAVSYPTPERLGLSEAVQDAYDFDRVWAFQSSDLGKAPEHRVGGYPSPVQGHAMELEAELASSGVYMGDASGYATADADREERARAEWRLLLQIDSDDDAGMMWGDVGMLYIWVRETDARRGDFSNAWCVLQCG